ISVKEVLGASVKRNVQELLTNRTILPIQDKENLSNVIISDFKLENHNETFNDLSDKFVSSGETSGKTTEIAEYFQQDF
ncbi:7391_t:CDS:2, partial [Gigaspora margarita]